MTETTPGTRAGFVALIGEPNAGKSTLLNRMVGAKVSIVTHKVQTTRARIRGVAMEGQAQIVFVDTPGLFRPRRRLDRAMVKAAWGGAADADIIVLLIEAHRGLTDGVEAIIDRMKDQIPQGQQVALAINKIDRVTDPFELIALDKKFPGALHASAVTGIYPACQCSCLTGFTGPRCASCAGVAPMRCWAWGVMSVFRVA